MDETVLYSVDDHYTVQPITPSLSAPDSDRREAVLSIVVTTGDPDPPIFYDRPTPVRCIASHTSPVWHGGIYTRIPSLALCISVLKRDCLVVKACQ